MPYVLVLIPNNEYLKQWFTGRLTTIDHSSLQSTPAQSRALGGGKAVEAVVQGLDFASQPLMVKIWTKSGLCSATLEEPGGRSSRFIWNVF